MAVVAQCDDGGSAFVMEDAVGRCQGAIAADGHHRRGGRVVESVDIEGGVVGDAEVVAGIGIDFAVAPQHRVVATDAEEIARCGGLAYEGAPSLVDADAAVDVDGRIQAHSVEEHNLRCAAVGYGVGYAGVEIQAHHVGNHGLLAAHHHALAAAESDGQAVAGALKELRSGYDAVGYSRGVAIGVVAAVDVAGHDERVGIRGAVDIAAVDNGVAGGGVLADGKGVTDIHAVYRQRCPCVARRQVGCVNEIARSGSGRVDVRRLKRSVVKCLHRDLNSLVLTQCLSSGQQCHQHDAQCKT